MHKCTWTDCGHEATNERVSEDGEVWARLCNVHDECLEGALESGSPKEIVSAWVNARGGREKAAARAARKGAVMPDCGDNSCRYATKRGGMRTNAGCRCDDCPVCGGTVRPGRPATHYSWCPQPDWVPPHQIPR